MIVTVVLFDFDGKPVGRANLPEGSPTPAVVIWNDMVYSYQDENIAGKKYRQVQAIEIPYLELRKAPGLA